MTNIRSRYPDTRDNQKSVDKVWSLSIIRSTNALGSRRPQIPTNHRPNSEQNRHAGASALAALFAARQNLMWQMIITFERVTLEEWCYGLPSGDDPSHQHSVQRELTDSGDRFYGIKSNPSVWGTQFS